MNVASSWRLLQKRLVATCLSLGAFAEEAKCRAWLEHVGAHPLKGLGEPIEVFALKSNTSITNFIASSAIA